MINEKSEEVGITHHELEMRARWLAQQYDLDKEKVVEALGRSCVSVENVIMDGFFRYLRFDPSLEEALLYAKPKVLLQIFLGADPELISRWLEFTKKLAGPKPDNWPGLEELCRWEAESSLLPD